MNKHTADQIISRAARLAILHYPEIAADDPAYSLAADVDWVLEQFPPHQKTSAVRELVAQVIIDPTGTRDAFTQAMYAAVSE